MVQGYGRRLFPLVGVEPPFTLGRDVVGEVVALGPLAWNFAKGQMVVAATHPTAEGAHADYTVTAETATALLPPSLAVERAAALPFAALTAWRALDGLAKVQPGQTVTVHGAAGSVGSFAAQYLSNHLGCKLIATCRPEQISQLQRQVRNAKRPFSFYCLSACLSLPFGLLRGYDKRSFAKTGSGQTQGKLKQRPSFLHSVRQPRRSSLSMSSLPPQVIKRSF